MPTDKVALCQMFSNRMMRARGDYIYSLYFMTGSGEMREVSKFKIELLMDEG